jgi:hypothetical protein
MDDYTVVLWLLKLGALVNLYCLVKTAVLAGQVDGLVFLSAQIVFAVSAYRCLFPVRYEDNVVFHDSAFSSVFVTRLLATGSEIASVFLYSHVLRLLNIDRVGWVNGLSWLMIVQVVVSQMFVWAAILTGRLELYVYEELGWANIFALNTLASAYLLWSGGGLGGREILLRLNLLFGTVYLPFQFIHLRTLRANASRRDERGPGSQPATASLASGLQRSIRVKNRRTDAASWGGLVGLIWMTSYWASVIPIWVYRIVQVVAAN